MCVCVCYAGARCLNLQGGYEDRQGRAGGIYTHVCMYVCKCVYVCIYIGYEDSEGDR